MSASGGRGKPLCERALPKGKTEVAVRFWRAPLQRARPVEAYRTSSVAACAANMRRRSLWNVCASVELARAHDCREAGALRPALSPCSR